jgi:hypothetical protein
MWLVPFPYKIRLKSNYEQPMLRKSINETITNKDNNK